jgi:hypothetical protein
LSPISTDQIFNHVNWGFDICRRSTARGVYDIYHVQIADGDVVPWDNIDGISHPCGGRSQRAEIDDTQELNYNKPRSPISATPATPRIIQADRWPRYRAKPEVFRNRERVLTASEILLQECIRHIGVAWRV